MAADLISSGGGGGTITIPEHENGDLILVLSDRGSSSNPPAVPSGFTSITFSSIGTRTTRWSYRISDGAAINISPSTTNRHVWLLYRNHNGIGEWANTQTALSENPAVVPALSAIAENGESKVAVLSNPQSLPDNESTTWQFIPTSGELTLARHASDTAIAYDTPSTVASWPGGTLAYDSDQNNNILAIEVKGFGGDPGTPPQGTTTIGTTTPTPDGAEVTYSYDDTDADGFELRVSDGSGWSTWTAVGESNPFTITGLEPETYYDAELRPYNADGPGAAAAFGFTTLAEPTVGWTVDSAVSAVGETSITITATPDRACDVYAVALRSTQPKGTSQQIIDGLDGNGDPAAAVADEFSDGSQVTLTLTGLTDDPTYTVGIAAKVPE